MRTILHLQTDIGFCIPARLLSLVTSLPPPKFANPSVIRPGNKCSVPGAVGFLANQSLLSLVQSSIQRTQTIQWQ